MNRLLLCLSLLLAGGCARSVLPSKRIIMESQVSDLRALVITHLPLGTPLAEVEGIFQEKFRRKVVVLDAVPEGIPGRRRFTAPEAKGDICLASELAMVWTGLGQTRTTSAYLLFDAAGRLKDVSVQRWNDSL